MAMISSRVGAQCWNKIARRAVSFSSSSVNSAIDSSANGVESTKPKLRLLTKKNCQLCDEAEMQLWSIPGIRDRLELVHVDILKEGNEDYFDLYRYEIPVFFLDKKFVSKNRLDTEKLLGLLQEREERL